MLNYKQIYLPYDFRENTIKVYNSSDIPYLDDGFEIWQCIYTSDNIIELIPPHDKKYELTIRDWNNIMLLEKLRPTHKNAYISLKNNEARAELKRNIMIYFRPEPFIMIKLPYDFIKKINDFIKNN